MRAAAFLAEGVTRRWRETILLWLLAAAALRLAAPDWEDVARDGNFAYLPADAPTMRAERLLRAAFPGPRAASQIALLAVRADSPLSSDDVYVAVDIARRFRNVLGAVRLAQARRLGGEAAERGGAAAAGRRALLAAALDALDEAVRLDRELTAYAARQREAGRPTHRWRSLAAAYHNRALAAERLARLGGRDDEQGAPERLARQAAADRRRAIELDPTLARRGARPAPDGADQWPLVDVWTWHDDVLGEKLITPRARLVVLQLTNEFMDTDNIRLVERAEAELDGVRRALRPELARGLTVGLTGAAAVGGDLLRSAKAALEQTERFTVLLILVILLVVYRSPLLLFVPLAVIGVSLVVSLNLAALLARRPGGPAAWTQPLMLFTTTRVFLVVVLFGAGTDYCLFLIARYREQLAAGLRGPAAAASALRGVGDALTASALTTIAGLAVMAAARYGKYRYSGPTIGLCLAVALAASLTLAPALLCWTERWGAASAARRRCEPCWLGLARWVVRRPGRVLAAALLVLAPLALYGLTHGRRVSFDFLASLDRRCPSKQGAEALRPHFPVGESGPIVVLVLRQAGGLDGLEGVEQIRRLGWRLSGPGVAAVRSIADPLGELPPGARVGLFGRSMRARVAKAHQRTARIFLASAPSWRGRVARLEVVPENNPFSPAAAATLARVERILETARRQPDSFWRDAQFFVTGLPAAIRDLRDVTESDFRRIQALAVAAVLLVLLLILRRPLICVYLIATVLLTYLVTIGAAQLLFRWAEGPAYQGLDWRAPLFLFVLLVALGQDYNVYLVSRVVQEQRRLGPLAGLRRAVARTGGIITSCGVIMAGAFLAMTSGVWLRALARLGLAPAVWGETQLVLRSTVQMGFALALGVLLDTFVVRTLLVPAFLALLARRPFLDPRAPAIRAPQAGAARGPDGGGSP